MDVLLFHFIIARIFEWRASIGCSQNSSIGLADFPIDGGCGSVGIQSELRLGLL